MPLIVLADEYITMKQVAAVRFHRNHRLMMEIFGDMCVPDPRSGGCSISTPFLPLILLAVVLCVLLPAHGLLPALGQLYTVGVCKYWHEYYLILCIYQLLGFYHNIFTVSVLELNSFKMDVTL